MQTFFIPSNIQDLQLRHLPVSKSLFALLKRLGVARLGDLSRLTSRDFTRTGPRGAKLLDELNHIIEFARILQHAAIDSENGSSSGVTDIAEVPRNSSWIFIPDELRERPVAKFKLSTRLANIFEFKRIVRLGDLHGLTMEEFTRSKNCGPKTTVELTEFIKSIRQDAALVRIPDESIPFNRDVFVVPQNAFDSDPYRLPLSVRLESALRRKGVKRLGDLHLVSKSELLKVRNCGKQSVIQLKLLLERVANGEFDDSAERLQKLTMSDLVNQVDRILARIRERNLAIVLLRFEEIQGQRMTLREVGSRFDLTPERARQIVENTLELIRREGGNRLCRQLNRIIELHQKNEMRPISELLEAELAPASAAGRFSGGFYVRLLNELIANL